VKAAILIGLATITSVVLVYLLFWPVPIDPVAWTPPEAPPMDGVYEPNHSLASIERLGEGVCIGPEDVAVDEEGRIYAGMEDGRIVRFRPDGTCPEVFVDTGGRPLGLHFDGVGNLLVCDLYRGLLSFTPDGTVTVLATQEGGLPFQQTNDVDVSADGTVYFSDSSFTTSDTMLEILEQRPHGRLLSYDPTLGEVDCLLDGLYYANGVAVSPDGSFVLVVETGRYRVRRYWLGGPRQGEEEVFIDNLPGFPDGISSDGEGTFWLALLFPRYALVDSLWQRPFLRKVVARLPEGLLSNTPRYGFVLGLNQDGQVIHNLQDPEGTYAGVSSVTEHGGMLYLGSLVEDAIGRLPTPESDGDSVLE
jgi:sugar lactone lactonase YvrE